MSYRNMDEELTSTVIVCLPKKKKTSLYGFTFSVGTARVQTHVIVCYKTLGAKQNPQKKQNI